MTRLLCLLCAFVFLAGCQTVSDPTRMTISQFRIEEPGKLETDDRFAQHYVIGRVLRQTFKKHGVVFEKGKRTIGSGYIHDNYPVIAPSGNRLIFVATTTHIGILKPKHHLTGAPNIGGKLIAGDKELIDTIIAETLANIEHVQPI